MPEREPWGRHETDRRSLLRGLGAGLLLPGAAARLAAAPDTARSPEDAAGDEDYWRAVQEAFAVDRTIVNLNNGGVSPAPRAVMDALHRRLDFANEVPARNLWQEQEPRLESVRQGLAALAGCEPEELAVTRNTSEALETCILGLDLKAGDEVVTTTQDYPRMLTAWRQRARRDGVVLRTVSFPVPPRSQADLLDRLSQALTPRTRVLHFCHITNLTGQVFPVRELCLLARQRGIQTIVDGAHAFGHLPLRLPDLGCDYYGTSLHKWLHAPIGNGFLYVRRERIKSLWPLFAAPAEMDGDIRKFEEIGTHPAAPHNAVAEALDFTNAIGVERKLARLVRLRDRWARRLAEHPRVKLLTSLEPGMGGALGTFSVEGMDVARLAQELLERHRILVTPIVHAEFQALRVTPSVYTTIAEVDRFAEAVERILARSSAGK